MRLDTDGTPGSPTFGQVIGQQGHYPYGEAWYSIGTTTKFIFTGYERDATGLDYALARYYDSSMGRFCSADPLEGETGDPQTWNRYAYVRDNPVNLTDPSGERFLSWLVDAFVALADVLSGGAFTPAGGIIVNYTTAADVMLSQSGNNPFIISPSGIGGGGGGGVSASSFASGQNPGHRDPCNPADPSNLLVMNFIHAHRNDAKDIADELHVSTEDILGLSGHETYWGTNRASTQLGNYFSQEPGGKLKTYDGDRYRKSGQDFEDSMGYSSVFGKSDPEDFAKNLTGPHNFNPGIKTKKVNGDPNFVPKVVGAIASVKNRINCPGAQ